MSIPPVARRLAVIGAGVAGATCAHLLANAGHQVQVFDKWRGVGGRLATRRHAQVHRWLYAHASRDAASPTARCQWYAACGLGVCSDALAGAGVEGAWLTGRALATAITADSLPTGERNNLAAKRTSGPQARGVLLFPSIGLH